MADITKIIDEVKELSVLELNELVKALEEEFGVSAAAPVAVAASPSATLRWLLLRLLRTSAVLV